MALPVFWLKYLDHSFIPAPLLFVRRLTGDRIANETSCSDLGRGECFKVDILFDNVDRSDRLKVFCTSVDKKFDVANQTKATTSYEVYRQT